MQLPSSHTSNAHCMRIFIEMERISNISAYGRQLPNVILHPQKAFAVLLQNCNSPARLSRWRSTTHNSSAAQ
jgi:hypothetical protein